MKKQRLTSIETLPEEVVADTQWLHDTILAHRVTQVEMLEEFNRRLKIANQKPASLSSLNRYVMKVRGGLVRRPRSIPQEHNISSTILQESFRDELLKKQGLNATLMLEAALSSLVSAKG